jgi:hypothetical protein
MSTGRLHRSFLGSKERQSKPLLVLILTVAMLGARCGGGDEASAEEWVGNVCTDATTWVKEIMGLEGRFETDVQAAGQDLDQIKSVLVGFFDDALSATDDFVQGVEETGVPDVEGGEQIAETVREGLNQARDVLADARADIEASSTDDPQAFEEVLTDATSSIGEGFERIGETLDRATATGAGGEELEAAGDSQPACRELEELGSGA